MEAHRKHIGFNMRLIALVAIAAVIQVAMLSTDVAVTMVMASAAGETTGQGECIFPLVR